MKCTKCGKEYEGNFCPYCGAAANPNKKLCPVCGKEHEEGKRYCSTCGHDFYSSSPKGKSAAAGAAAKIKRVPKKVWVIAVLLLIVIAVAIILAVVLGNKFRLGVVEDIELGSSKQQVIEILGEPYDYDENSSVFTYYSDDYRKLLEENDSFNPDDIEDWDDLENAFEDALELEQRLQTEEYKYIEVRFDSEGAVTSVLFDNSRTEQTKDEAKTIESYEVLSDTSDMLNIVDGIQFTVHYTDGSYYIGDAATNINFGDESSTVTWRDRFGNDFEYPLREEAFRDSLYDETTKILQVYTDSGFANIPKSVQTVIIHDGVTSIGDNVFAGCTSLESITIPDSVTRIGGYAFRNCSSLTSITIPDSVTSIGGSAFEDCTSLTSITIPDSVTSIGGYAFRDCSSLESITIGNGVTSIGDNVFAGCTSLESITIPDSVTSIGDHAFYNCDSLTRITIPNSVTSIGDWAFMYCDSLTSITIPDGVTRIGYGAFEGCTSLTSITIPDSVTSICDLAFFGCNSLETVYYKGSEGQWDEIDIVGRNYDLWGANIIYNAGG